MRTCKQGLCRDGIVQRDFGHCEAFGRIFAEAVEPPMVGNSGGLVGGQQ